MTNAFTISLSSLTSALRINTMKYSPLHSRPLSSPATRMTLKLSSLAVILIACYSLVSTYFVVDRVVIPDGCARACPPQSNPSRFICGRNRATGQLGMFDSECFFGRYNHCIYVNQRKSLEFNFDCESNLN